MNLDWYKTFFQLANSGSFSRAAKEMYITQPAVSHAIAQLENALGCDLFLRNRQGVVLTQQGRILYDNLINAFDSISAAEKAITEIQTFKKGEIKFGASDTLFSFYLIPILKLFKEEHPAIKISVISDTTSKMLNLIKSGDIDFGIVNMPVDDKNLILKPIMKVQDCFVVGQKYKHLASKKMHIGEIVQYPLILLNNSTSTRKYINLYFQKHFLSVVPDFEFGNTNILVEFAKNDFGIACVYKSYIKRELENEELYEIPLYEKIPERNIEVAFLKSVPLSIISNAFIEKLENVLSLF